MPVAPDTQSNLTIWEVVLAAVTVIVSLWGSSIRGTRALDRDREKLNEKIDQAKLELERKIHDEADTATHDFGETVTAIRAKMTEMEIWNRDNFVSKTTFNAIMERWQAWFTRFEDKVDRRFDHIDAKLNSKSTHD